MLKMGERKDVSRDPPDIEASWYCCALVVTNAYKTKLMLLIISNVLVQVFFYLKKT